MNKSKPTLKVPLVQFKSLLANIKTFLYNKLIFLFALVKKTSVRLYKLANKFFASFFPDRFQSKQS